MSKKKSADEQDAGKLQQTRDIFDYNYRKWEPVYKEGDTDVRYRAGKPWKDTDVKTRDDAGRPHMVFDELGQYLNEAVNDVRANPIAPKFSPAGDEATDESARFYEDLSREIDYQSDANLADTTAYENCLERSFGFVRIATEYETPRSFNQVLRVRPVPNPACVYPDADAVSPDGKDWKNLTFVESYSREEFKRAFPRAQYKTFSNEQIQVMGAKWGGEDHVQVAEHWEVEMVEGILVQCEIPATLRQPARIVEYLEGTERKPRNAREIQRRVTEIPKVQSFLTTGLEILDNDGTKFQPWAGDAIPFASCYGKILWENNGSGADRTILSMTRLARDPYMAYCFAVTSLIEAIGTITKNPFFAYEGTLDAAQMNEIAKSLHEPVAVLLSKPFINGMPGQLMPLPQRNPMSVDLSSYAISVELCRQAIRSAMSVGYLPTPAQRNNEKSGVALEKIAESGQRGSYHFKDSYHRMLRRRAEIEENLIDRIYDTPRDVNVRGRDNEPKRFRINDPRAQGENVMKTIKGRHSVTIDVGPEAASERDAANTFIDNFVSSPLLGALEPAKRDKLISLAIKARNMGVMGDKMADVISPPEGKNGQPDAAQALGLLQQAQQQIIPALQQQIQQLEAEKAAKVTETQGRLAVAAQTDATKKEIAGAQLEQKAAESELRSQTDIRLQEMEDQIARMEMLLKANIEGQKLQQQREIEGARLEHSTAMTERGHEQGLESGRVAHSQAEESAENAAAREPNDA